MSVTVVVVQPTACCRQGEGGGGTACNGEPAALVIPAAEARARSRQAGRARALWARAHRLWVGILVVCNPGFGFQLAEIYTIVETQKTAEGHVLVVSVQMNTLECVYVKLMLYNIKSMFDGLMQNGRGPSCRSPALPLLRLGPRSTDAASRLPTSSVRSGRRRARQRRPHRQEAPACAAHRGAI